MGFTVTLTDTDERIEALALKAMRSELDLALRLAAPAIRIDVANLADRLIRGTPEHASLLNGQLMGELGLADPDSKLRSVLQIVRDGVEVWSTPIRVIGRNLEGGLNIGLLRSSYEDLLSLSDASYVSEPSGSEIPWLGWLIGAGDRIIVYDYDVHPALTPAQRARSRSKRALMFEGKGWKVPGNFSGTFEDNFLTRAFDVAGVEAAFDRIVQSQVSRRLR